MSPEKSAEVLDAYETIVPWVRVCVGVIYNREMFFCDRHKKTNHEEKKIPEACFDA